MTGWPTLVSVLALAVTIIVIIANQAKWQGKTENRMDASDKRVDTVEKRLDAQVAKAETKGEELAAVVARLDGLDAGMQAMNSKLDILIERRAKER